MESAQTDALGHRRGKKRGDEEWFGPMRMNREGDSAKAASTAASAARPDATPPTKFDKPARMPTPSGGSATSGTVVIGAGASSRMTGAAGGTRGREPNISQPGSGVVTVLGTARQATIIRVIRVAPPNRGDTRIAAAGGGMNVGSRPSGGIVTGAGSGVSGGVPRPAS